MTHERITGMSHLPIKGELSVHHDAYRDTYSIEGEGETVCDLWRLNEETHSRHPHFEGREKEIAHRLALAWNCHDELVAALNDIADEAGDNLGRGGRHIGELARNALAIVRAKAQPESAGAK